MSPLNDTTTADTALTDAYTRWKKTVEAELKGADFDKKLVTRTFDGTTLQPLYTRADVKGLSGLDSAPGNAPFLRGVRAAGYRGERWEVAQEILAATPGELNAALLADLNRGQNAVVINLQGAPALSELGELTKALEGVDLSAIPLHVCGGGDALPAAALLLSYARTRRVAWGKLHGSITADPLAAWASAGSLPCEYAASLDALAAWTKWAAKHAQHLGTIGVNSTIWGDAGATPAQELGFALASAAEYLRELSRRRVELQTAAERIRFGFAIGPQFFTEVAKFRALRPLWTRVLSAFGVPIERAAAARVHARTGRWNKTLLDPHVNMLRVTTEAASAVLGGCDSLHIAPFDEVTGATNDFSRRIARNVHTLLAEEFGFTQTADAAGGSWYVEKLTDEIARQAWKVFQTVEGLGGMAAALRKGHPQQVVAEAAAQKSGAVAMRRLGLIGTNLFPNLKEKPLTAGKAAASQPIAANTGTWAMPAAKATWSARFEAALAAASAGANLGALAAFSPASGKPEASIKPVAPWRASAVIEHLRAAADAFAKSNGARPRVFLAKMGPVLQHKARADFSAGFFAVGGFEVLAKQSFETAEAAAEAAAKSGAPVAVLCSTDETYPALVPAFTAAAKQANPKLTVVLAGKPADAALTETFVRAGVDEFIHVRADVPALLGNLLKKIGASV